jgi:type I restriction enzyme S subunit
MTTGWKSSELGDIASVIGRGITPRYVLDHGMVVINQKCIRNGRLSLEPARLHDAALKPVRADKLLRKGDVLVNSTGVGTLGRSAPVRSINVQMAVDSHISIVRPSDTVDPTWLAYVLLSQESEIEAMAEGSTGQTELSKQRLAMLPVVVPTLPVQRAIGALLGALDTRIDWALHVRRLLRDLGTAHFERATLTLGGGSVKLANVVTSIARGVAPKYADDDAEAPLVLNQKCIRDGWVSVDAARQMVSREVSVSKKAASGDILINSTGVGTLGRVGRWHEGAVFVDGHVTIVRPDPEKAGPTTLAYSLFGKEADIEDRATGSTGQTELSPTSLGLLEIKIPPVGQANELESFLTLIEHYAAKLTRENARINTLRNTLIPSLLSGRISIEHAEQMTQEVVR